MTTASQKAAERYPVNYNDGQTAATIQTILGEGYSTCYTEEVEPRDAAIRELRALVRQLLYHGESLSALIEVASHQKEGDSKLHWEAHVASWAYARSKATELGFTPTNTTAE